MWLTSASYWLSGPVGESKNRRQAKMAAWRQGGPPSGAATTLPPLALVPPVPEDGGMAGTAEAAGNEDMGLKCGLCLGGVGLGLLTVFF